MNFTALTIDVLKSLGDIVGSYGWGIILLTVIIRIAMWPLGVSQQRSMRNMQLLQPKMKMIQERYKSNPQMMQMKMMEFYKEHKFNPMSGCLPALIQMPIFILLYSALMSPMFIQVAGNVSFYFVKRLDATLKGNAGVSYDNEFNVSRTDSFSAGKTVKVYLKDEAEPVEIKVAQPRKFVQVQGDVIPGETLDLKINLDDLKMRYSQLAKVEAAEVSVIDNNTREIENVKFAKSGDILMAQVPTKEISTTTNLDVALLVFLFVASMFLSVKVMNAMNSKNIEQDPAQAQMQKMMGNMMPIMLGVTFVFIPIPAGVLLYLVSSNVIQIVQSVIINKQLEAEDIDKKLASGVNRDLNVRKVEAKDIKNVEGNQN